MVSEEDKEVTKTAMGASSYKDGYMSVRDFGNKTGTQDTVMHECVHMMWKQFGIRYVANNEKNEEALVTLWTQAFLSLLKDNPKLVEYLQS